MGTIITEVMGEDLGRLIVAITDTESLLGASTMDFGTQEITRTVIK